MAILHGYSTLERAKTRQGIRDITDDPTIEMVIAAVSRMIDDYCQRRFWSAVETRVYSAPGPPYPYYTVSGPTFFTSPKPTRIFLDDFLSISALLTDDNGDRTYPTTWAVTDYDLYPLNAASSDFGVQPYWEIRSAPLGNYRFPFTAQGIKVTGVFGYSSVTPPVIEEACLAQVALIMKAPDVALGVSGSGPVSVQVPGATGLHPFVKRMVDPFKKWVVG